jgi:hypothetical protein
VPLFVANKLSPLVLIVILSLVGFRVFADPPGSIPPSSTQGKEATIRALQEFNLLVGTWRGVGQLKRGSQVGAWQEHAESLWELKPQSQGIRWNIESGKQWKSALLSYNDEKKQYTLTATLSDDSTREYRGTLEEKRLVLDSEVDDKNEIHRVTVNVLNENRLTFLIEKRGEKQSFQTRVAEIAYQREGTRLAAAGASAHECVVTGGLGTISVVHNGKTYYVCCTGCRDAFKDDPEGILAEYQKRKAAEKEKK